MFTSFGPNNSAWSVQAIASFPILSSPLLPQALVSQCFSRLARARLLGPPLLLVHSLVRLRQEFAKRNRALGIELRHANAEGQFVPQFAGIRLLQILLQSTQQDLLCVIRCHLSQHDKFVAAQARNDVGTAEGFFESVRCPDQGQIPFSMPVG